MTAHADNDDHDDDDGDREDDDDDDDDEDDDDSDDAGEFSLFPDVMSCHVFCHVMPCHVMSCHVLSYPSIHSFIQSFGHSFISLIRPFLPSVPFISFHSRIHALMHSFIHSLIHALMH